MGGPLFDSGSEIAVNATGVYTTGGFRGTVDFDPGPGIYNLTSLLSSDAFVHKMSQCINSTSSALTITDCKNYTLNGITYTASGVYTQTILNNSGCDSIITLNLTINRINTEVNASTCNNYTWHGHTYNTSGMYSDTVITAIACDSIITLHLTVLPKSFSTLTQSICNGQTYLGHSISGIYVDTLIAANLCDSIRTLQLTVLSKPSPFLGADTTLCTGDLLTLYPGSFTTYSWQNGSSQNHFIVKQSGLYSVMVSNSCGSANDEIWVTEKICDIYFPSAFTPNNDGRNDLFKMLNAFNITDYHLVVYDRYGQKVFETTDPASGWTGKFKGILLGTGVYVWQCNFKRSDIDRYMKGSVVLIK